MLTYFILMFFSYCLLTLLQMSLIFPHFDPLHSAPTLLVFTTLLSVSMGYAYMHTCSLANLF